MIQLPSDIERRDVDQWCREGIVMIDRKIPAAYRGCDSNVVGVRRLDNGERENYCYERVSVHWPRCGSLNVPGTALYLARRQTQQYRRTYNSAALTVVFPHKWAIIKSNAALVQKYRHAMNTDIIQAAFNPEYPDWGDAMDMLGEQPLVAINPYIIIGGTPEAMRVYYRARLCGSVKDGRFIPTGKGLPASRAFKLLHGRVDL